MFASHTAQIRVDREDPGQGFDAEKSAKQVVESFAAIAERIVVQDWLKSKRPEKTKKAEDKIRKLIEFDERMRSTKKFLEVWNRWRLFYFDLSPVTPKNRGQLTSIENAIQYAIDHKLDLNMLVATIHRAYLKRKFKPGFAAILTHGTEAYEQFYDVVIGDVDRAEYEERALE